MTFDKKEKDVLEEIVMQEGDCLDYTICTRCPFKSECLIKFLNRANPSTGHRLTEALDALGDDLLEDDDAKIPDKQ